MLNQWSVSLPGVRAMLALGFLGLMTGGLLLSEKVSYAFAGTFDTVHYLSPGDFAIGVAPELGLSNGANLGANIKYTQGLNELTNAAAILGVSNGERKFRLGGNVTFDIFPDMDGQPGIGIAGSGMYYQLAKTGLVELTAIPYVHKTFHVGGGDEIEPFLSVPVGMAFSEGRYKALSSVNVGALFKNADNFRYVVELGVALNNTESYFSGGIVYYH
jgi:hypothetical protein